MTNDEMVPIAIKAGFTEQEWINSSISIVRFGHLIFKNGHEHGFNFAMEEAAKICDAQKPVSTNQAGICAQAIRSRVIK